MRFFSILTAGVLVALGVAAPPAQEALGPSPAIASVKLPTSYQQINQARPKQSYPQNFVFKVSQSAGGRDNIGTLLRFTGIPTGANVNPCALRLSFTPDYPINSTGSTLINVFALTRNITASDTWGTYFPTGQKGTPANGFLWGTTTITGGNQYINSQACQSSLNYLVLLDSQSQAGEVTFVDAGNNLSGIGGFYIEYNG